MKSQKILITGGSRGLGKELVVQFLNQDCEVHVVARNSNSELNSPKLKFHILDLFNSREVVDFAKTFITSHGLPDLLINNAGSGAFFEWDSFPINQIEKQINLLFLSPVLMCRVFAPKMASQQKGKIVNITSLATIYPLPFMPLYNSTKSALSSFTRSMQIEYHSFPSFIDVILGDVKTEFNDRLIRTTSDGWSERVKSTWSKVEKQLHDSPVPNHVAKRLVLKINKCNGGLIYEGGFIHRNVYSHLSRFLPNFLKNKILQKRYFD